jgi:hypothetical protein
MVKLFRHRQPKGADTDAPHLSPPRHIPTLPFASVWRCPGCGRFTLDNCRDVAARRAMRHSRT